MAIQTVFKRYEYKYMLNAAQKAAILEAMKPYMTLDSYGRSVIQNIYYDTDSYLLVRRSMEKPEYKEKLRVRSYGTVTPDSIVFVELKKKYESVVYKRRICMPEEEAMNWLNRGGTCTKQGQIADEIEYFRKFYKSLHPAAYISYEREAFFSNDGSDFRVTFDENILCRQDKMSLREGPGGELVLPSDVTLMEVKCSGGIPLWMTGAMSREHIYLSSFSKYGTAYQNIIYPAAADLTEEVKANA